MIRDKWQLNFKSRSYQWTHFQSKIALNNICRQILPPSSYEFILIFVSTESRQINEMKKMPKKIFEYAVKRC